MNAVLDASLILFPLLLILYMMPLFLLSFLIFLLLTLTIKFISLLTICSVKKNLLFFYFLFVSVNNGIPIWFRCFKGLHNPHAYSLDLIKQGISFCHNLFSKKNYHIIFLADRWFPHVDILSHIQSLRLLLLHSR